MADLPRTADIAVIGAGVMGTSAAYHAAALGADVVLIERDTIGSGSTSKAAGGFRAQFSDELNIAMAIENIARLERFSDEFETEIDFKQWGYLILLREHEIADFTDALELQNRYGVPSRMLTPEEAAAIVPGIEIHDLAGATFCPTDGYCTPEAVAQGYAAGAVRSGATVVQSCSVTGLGTSDGVVTSVETTHGTVSVDSVVLTAGVWSVDLAAAVGLVLPITAIKRHVWLTDGDDPYPHELPLTIDFATGFYFHREGDGLLVGGRESTIDELAPAALNRAPAMLDLEIRPGWWGYYEISPDHNALVGAATSPERLFYATGFSGHGFQQGPVVGEHLAQRALGVDLTFDLTAFDVTRFDSGDLKPEGHFV